MNAFAPNATIFKIFLISLLPLILIILYSFIWLSMWLLLRKYFEDMLKKREKGETGDVEASKKPTDY